MKKNKIYVPKKAVGNSSNVLQPNKGFITYLKAQVTTNPLSLKNYIRSSILFEQFLKDRNRLPKQITQEDINEFIIYLQEAKNLSSNSMIPMMGALRHYLRYYGFNPSSKGGNIQVSIPKSQATRTNQVLSQAEIQELFNATQNDPLANSIIKTLYYSGLRRTELMNLDLGDVDFKRKIILVRNGKGMNNQPETIPISDIALQSIQKYLEVRPKPKQEHEKALFLTSTRKRFSRSGVLYLIRKAQENTTIAKRIYPHMFRASIITHMHNAGASILHIKQLSRHRSTTALEIYIRSSDEEKKQIYDTYVPKINNQEVPKQPPEPKPEPKKPEPQDPMVGKPSEELEILRLKVEQLRLENENLKLRNGTVTTYHG